MCIFILGLLLWSVGKEGLLQKVLLTRRDQTDPKSIPGSPLIAEGALDDHTPDLDVSDS